MIKNREEYLKLVDKLNYYTYLYDKGIPEISDKDWDSLYFDLVEYEKLSHFIAGNSPTNKISFEIKSELNKVKHNHSMLSLDKTKDINEVKKFINNNDAIVMAKMDGLTCSLTYDNGRLILAETRGNGIEGEDITHNAKVIKSIPKEINYTGKITIDGEVICTYKDFEKFNSEYKNPRNFASGSIRLLDSSICAKRNLTFIAWDLISLDSTKIIFYTLSEKLKWISQWFLIVPFNTDDIYNVEKLKNKCKELSYPIDGLVYKYNNIKEYNNKGVTSHHPSGAISYKFYDDTYESKLLSINWSSGRTGSLTPVAHFESVEIDGTDVQNASLHNISIMESVLGKTPYIGQKLSIIKANQIIPQIESADLDASHIDNNNILSIPNICPICGSMTKIKQDKNTKVLICTNSNCSGKFNNDIKHFTNKGCFNIESLSNKTIDKFIDLGLIKSYKDIFNLKEHYNELIIIEGFGEKSINKILDNIEQAKIIELPNLISSIGIPNVEKQTAITLAEKFNTWDNFISAVENNYDFTKINGIGEKIAKNILNFDYSKIKEIIPMLNIITKNITTSKLSNKTFCITGKLNKKRDEIINIIENNGGKVTSVNKNLTYLICNDKNSNSSKMKKAKELNISIISEEEFENMLV